MCMLCNNTFNNTFKASYHLWITVCSQKQQEIKKTHHILSPTFILQGYKLRMLVLFNKPFWIVTEPVL